MLWFKLLNFPMVNCIIVPCCKKLKLNRIYDQNLRLSFLYIFFFAGGSDVLSKEKVFKDITEYEYSPCSAILTRVVISTTPTFFQIVMEGWWYVISVSVVTVLPLVWWLLQGRGNSRGRLPPRKSGWLPWLGVAIEFGKAPLHYIYQAHKEV